MYKYLCMYKYIEVCIFFEKVKFGEGKYYKSLGKYVRVRLGQSMQI